jgi:hypothetical protein
MTETTTIPFDAQQAPAPTGPQFDTEPAGNRSKLLALGAGAGVLVLAVAGYFLFFSGGSSTTGTPAVLPTHAVPVPSASAPAAGPAKPAKITPKSFGHDPFKPLVQPADPAGAVGGAGTSTTTGTTAGTGTGTTTGTGTGTTTGTTVGGTGTGTGTTTGVTSPTPTKAYRFQVLHVSSDNRTIDVRVNGVAHTGLRVGEVFASIFKVRFIGGVTNSFQIGDETFNVVGGKAVSLAP